MPLHRLIRLRATLRPTASTPTMDHPHLTQSTTTLMLEIQDSETLLQLTSPTLATLNSPITTNSLTTLNNSLVSDRTTTSPNPDTIKMDFPINPDILNKATLAETIPWEVTVILMAGALVISLLSTTTTHKAQVALG